jgi:hypothetical protein
LVRKFYRTFYAADEHLRYVREMTRRHPDTRNWFAARYRALPAGARPTAEQAGFDYASSGATVEAE